MYCWIAGRFAGLIFEGAYTRTSCKICKFTNKFYAQKICIADVKQNHYNQESICNQEYNIRKQKSDILKTQNAQDWKQFLGNCCNKNNLRVKPFRSMSMVKQAKIIAHIGRIALQWQSNCLQLQLFAK